MNVREQTVNAIRVLSAEAIQKANSGHPGLPLGSAPIGYTIFADFLKFNPKDPKWEDRDRFVLSAGHGSMLNYSLLYLFGYDISKEDLMNFRQLGYKTPGHPEYGHTPVSRRRPAPSGRASPTPSAWRRGGAPRRHLQPRRVPRRRPLYLRPVRRRMPRRGHLLRGVLFCGDA